MFVIHCFSRFVVVFFFFKQKTAYEMRISDWSSDVCSSDLVGVEAMRFQETSNGLVPMFRHSGLHVEMPWILESHGTQSFIKMFPMLTLALAQGGVCIIDEFDASIHPLVLPELIGWFYDSEGRDRKSTRLNSSH